MYFHQGLGLRSSNLYSEAFAKGIEKSTVAISRCLQSLNEQGSQTSRIAIRIKIKHNFTKVRAKSHGNFDLILKRVGSRKK